MKQLFIMLIAASFWSACQQVVNIDLPPHEPRLVLHAFWSQGQNEEIWAWLGNNISVLDNTRLDTLGYSPMDRTIPYEGTVWVNNATVELYKDANLLQTLRVENGARIYTGDLLVDDLDPTASYELRASAPNYPSISANIDILALPVVDSIIFVPEGVSSNGQVYDLIQAEINDPAGVENYYMFLLKYTPKDSSWGTFPYYQYLESPDQNAEYSNRGLILADKNFNGSTKSIDLWTFPLDTFNYQVDLEVYNLGKAIYLFNRSLDLYYEAESNPFAEPVLIYSNVKNGRGIASGNSRRVFPLN